MIEPVATTRSVDKSRFDFINSIPFILVHLMCFAVIWTGISCTAALVCLFLYVIRMFAITAFYHRYFSHRSYKTTRTMQFVMAIMGSAAVQKGALWWAAHHRHHHRHSDTENDIHSPGFQGIWRAHVGWITARQWSETNFDDIKDFSKYPELMFLNRYYMIVPALLGCSCFAFGAFLEVYFPWLNTGAMQMLVCGFFISTVLLYHGTFCINSMSHLWGRKRYVTGDESRNSLILALITLGEGWHNNHHFYPGAERQGHYWWEIDVSHYGLVIMSWFGLVWDLHSPPAEVLKAGQLKAVRAGVSNDFN